MDEESFLVTDLPVELTLCVLRHLTGEELALACAASALWASVVRQEEVWRKACEHRWPEAFVDVLGCVPAATMAPAPLATNLPITPLLPSIICL